MRIIKLFWLVFGWFDADTHAATNSGRSPRAE